eukprot:g7992.t1
MWCAANTLSTLYNNYVVVLLIGAVLYSMTHISMKVLTDTVSVFQILVIRSLVSIPAMILVIRRINGRILGERHVRTLVILRGLFGGISFILVTLSTHLLPLVDAAFLLNTYAVFTVMISFLAGMEKPTFISCLGIIGCVTGVTFIAQPPFIFGNDSEDWDIKRVSGVITAILSQILLAIVLIIISKIGTAATAFTHVFIQNLFILFMSLPVLPSGYPKSWKWTVSLAEIGLYALFVSAGTVFQLAMSRGFQIGPPARSAIIYLSNTLYSAAFGVLVLSDDANVFTFVGGGLVLLSVVVVVLDSSRVKRAAAEQEKLNDLEEELIL